MKEFVGILVVTALFCVGGLFLCSTDGLSWMGITAPTGSNQMSLNEASEGVTTWMLIAVAFSGGSAILWWALGVFVFKAGRGEEHGWITRWWLLFILPVGAAICAAIFEPKIEGNAILLIAFDVLGGMFCYWFATAMFSPPLTKHVPPLSRFRFIE